MLQRGVDGFLVTNLINVRYLSGFRGTLGFIFVTKKKNIFVTDFRYREEVEGIFSGPAAFEPRMEWEIVIEKGNRSRIVKMLIKANSVGTLGLESSVSYDFFENLSRVHGRLKPLRGIVEGLRAEKDDNEVALIRKAIERAEAAFHDVKPHVRKGVRENTIARMLEERLKKRGCNHIPFDIIVASGSNSAMPHAKVSDRRLSPGDLVVVDWGGEADGYCSDMTRTFLLSGGDVFKKKEVYQTVLSANRKAVASVSPGIPGKVVDGAARASIKGAGYGDYFGHGTGHGVGLEVHETPRVTWSVKDKILERMVFTIEPGIYVPGLGGVRIEDMVLVKAGKAEVLTTLPRNLEII